MNIYNFIKKVKDLNYCPICGKEFNGFFSASGHMQVHFKEKENKDRKKFEEVYGKV